MNRQRRRETPADMVQTANAAPQNLALGKQAASANSVPGLADKSLEVIYKDDQNYIVLDPADPHLYLEGVKYSLIGGGGSDRWLP